jgi:hypothetical protein
MAASTERNGDDFVPAPLAVPIGDTNTPYLSSTRHGSSFGSPLGSQRPGALSAPSPFATLPSSPLGGDCSSGGVALSGIKLPSAEVTSGGPESLGHVALSAQVPEVVSPQP